jgi:diguanylate cyclase (GGDEF)-like protein/PAS domain S-box-containing protein
MTKDKEELYQSILGRISDGVYVVDRDLKVNYWNRGAVNITGYQVSDVIGKLSTDSLLEQVDENGVVLSNGECPLTACLADGQEHEALVFMNHADGQRIPVKVHTLPIFNADGAISGAVEIFQDHSSHMFALEQISMLQKATLLDTLTGVGVRHYTQARLEEGLAMLKDKNASFSIFFIDVDHFKQANDRYGHEAGDRVLAMVASTLVHACRSFDFVGRWGGDEFVVIASNSASSRLSAFGERMRALVAQGSIVYGAFKIRVTISLGGTVARPEDTVESLVTRADQLMYESKASGGNKVSVEN